MWYQKGYIEYFILIIVLLAFVFAGGSASFISSGLKPSESIVIATPPAQSAKNKIQLQNLNIRTITQIPLPTPTEIPGPPTTIANIIPMPVSVESTGKRFAITNTTNIYVDTGSQELQQIGQYLQSKLRPATGFALNVVPTQVKPNFGSIYLTLNNSDPSIGTEGYNLDITPLGITLSANAPAGIFHGIQTIRQLLPPTIDASTVQTGPWIMSTGTIHDFPRFAWRGMMLDVARHFFGVADVEKLIDELAYYKLSVFHLHLTDNEGWRLQILSPLWSRVDRGTYFTQAQFKAIVSFAKARYITVVPEIDMPGHMNAALSAYPGLRNCDSSIDPSNSSTFSFIDDVIKETAALTLGQYFHIGTDESCLSDTDPGAYNYFIDKTESIVSQYGRQTVMWNEGASAPLHSGTIVQFWNNSRLARAAVGKGAKIILSPWCKAYIEFLYTYGNNINCPLQTVENAYSWNPATSIGGVGEKNIMGVEGTYWSDERYAQNIYNIEYYTFPRIIGFGEIGWSAQNGRSWNEYKVRLGMQGLRLREIGVNYYRSPEIPWN